MDQSQCIIVVGPPNLRDNFLVLIEENSENVPVDLRQEPAAFPEPTQFTWNRDGQQLNGLDQTFSNLTFGTIRRGDAGNYAVSATNFVLNSTVEQVGTDTGSFTLNVICKLAICMYMQVYKLSVLTNYM